MAGRPRSLRLELIATLTVVVMMAVVSLSLTGELLGRWRHEAQQDALLAEHTRSLGAIVAPLLDPGALGGLQGGPVEQVLRPSVGSMGIEAIEIHRIDHARARHDVLVSVGLPPPLPAPRPDASSQPVALDDGLRIVDQGLRVFGPERGRVALILRVVARPSPWSRLGDFRTTFLLAGGVGLVLVVLGGVLLEAQALRPLRAVRSAADEVAGGRLDVEVPAQGPSELSALADAFNRMTASLRDQIEQNVAQRESLVRAEQLASVGRLSAGVAHEVGNPLAAVLGYVELLLDARSEPASSAEQRALLERCRTQLERIQSIVGQLLDYSRPAEGRAQAVVVHEAIERLLSLLRHDPRCRDVVLRLSGDRTAEALADPAHLDQVVQNLVVNACRAASAEPSATEPMVELRIDGDTEPDAIAIEVQDTGPGVPDEIRPRLFEPFVTTARAGEGTGLGLAISRGLVEGMHGHLSCLDSGARPPLRPESSPGAVFRVILPRAGSRTENAEPQAAVEGPHR
ncbi:sensor histidine kinase [Paraliomyxa miuraensis]|uniref:sensor histidine kinase n=1 Tax=Paraliomyxa miuraensis TaxID=376150 RepID=UPI00224EB745|nr:HAMP domain-containing sensor histidine kinase [Paraliomyxa miuraensis]MCX4244840.1 HAMP domain-containing histidine kinase [Paraliomyxa miuraensis]